ncbi:hypothetical protein I4I73_31765 [Pseudonocardia sp. KRD-184]|uniref:NTP pyrophosphohydrolase n=1 Tax=Pseudonocardia oceani TaxID=2792013 RepID=A0ABS6UIW3_9PSEU|nr:hypothetical protein [Pseudonocardia oceani]MBW0100562.1 hypothetical protein [Pseudonocardia oceani]MBW0110194.1 hypothetical protein [Pseudonocardia oceani]MBW0122399.1 hypothetical protein [Pseudonocardia oceani]MBW0132195.1 hypothetical protein [Pseudonocardia oceani]
MTALRHLVVDGANVVGSRPDGWWRDRAGAAQRLAARLAAALDAGPGPLGLGDGGLVHLVLEGAARTAEPAPHPRLRVVRATADGDGAIVDVVRSLGTGVLVVTADRGLVARVTAEGARTVGPSALLRELDGRAGPDRPGPDRPSRPGRTSPDS